MTTYLVTDDNGTPTGFLDHDQITSHATRLAHDVAETSHDPALLNDIMAAHLTEAGASAFGYVASAALRILVEHILNPVLDVTDALHQHGHLAHDLRAGLADAARNARETLA